MEKEGKKIKLAMFDIDGTLVKGEEVTVIQPLTRKMFDVLHEHGVYLGLASGRYIDDLLQYKDKWSMDYQFDALVGVNGAKLYDNATETEHTYFELSSKDILDILIMMAPFDIQAHIYYEDETLYTKDDYLVEEAIKNHWGRSIRVAKNFEEMSKRPANKVMFFTPEDKSTEIEEYAKAHCGDNYIVARTRPTMIEFMAAGCTKPYAIRKFCELHGLTMDQVVAFGDTSNDNEMLAECGLGVCLKNGTDDTKAVADVITDYECLEDGVGHFIEDHLLERI